MIGNKRNMDNPIEMINDIKTFLHNNLIFCSSCNTRLTPNWINLDEIMINCENQYVNIFLTLSVSFHLILKI